MLQLIENRILQVNDHLQKLQQEMTNSNGQKLLFSQLKKEVHELSNGALEATKHLMAERAQIVQLRESIQHLLIQQHLSELLSRTRNVDDVLTSLFEITRRTVPFHSGAVYLFDRVEKAYVLRYSQNLTEKEQMIIRSHLDEGVIQWVMSEKRPVAIPNLRDLKQDSPSDASGFIIVPLLACEKRIGFFEIWQEKLQEIPAATYFETLAFLGMQTAIAVENNLLYEQLNHANDLLRKSQLQIIQAEKMAGLGVMSSGMAHEVNNPLQIILARVQLLKRKTKEESLANGLALIERESKRISEIVSGMLRYAKQQQQHDVQPVKIDSMIRDVILLFQPKFNLQKIEVVTDFSPAVPELVLNAGEIEQIFLNLFENSRHAMKEGGRLSVRTYLKGKEAYVEVEDTGCGISKEDLSQIFIPFFTTKAPNEGTGLGLFLCYGIIERHKGKIQVESTLGKGTKFVLRFPVSRPPSKF